MADLDCSYRKAVVTKFAARVLSAVALLVVGCGSDPAPFTDPFDDSLETTFVDLGLPIVDSYDESAPGLSTYRYLVVEAPDCGSIDQVCLADVFARVPWAGSLSREESFRAGERRSAVLDFDVGEGCRAQLTEATSAESPSFDPLRSTAESMQRPWFVSVDCG